MRANNVLELRKKAKEGGRKKATCKARKTRANFRNHDEVVETSVAFSACTSELARSFHTLALSLTQRTRIHYRSGIWYSLAGLHFFTLLAKTSALESRATIINQAFWRRKEATRRTKKKKDEIVRTRASSRSFAAMRKEAAAAASFDYIPIGGQSRLTRPALSLLLSSD